MHDEPSSTEEEQDAGPERREEDESTGAPGGRNPRETVNPGEVES